MSRQLFSLNPDLQRLRDAGYFVQVRGSLLLMREVPYVDAQRQVRRGTLVTPLDLAGDRTRKPESHVMHWEGDFPCAANGDPIRAISHQSVETNFGHGITTRHSFSSKPGPQGYADYFEKMSTYANILAGPAAVLDPNATPRIYRPPEDVDSASAFNYLDSASDRVGLAPLAENFKDEVVSIIGTGGSGAYILDFVAKTPVAEIRLFDADEFIQHNAFRAPGAPSLEELREAPLKVEYLAGIYSRMHRGIKPHRVRLDGSNLSLLEGTTLAFLSMDAGPEKLAVVRWLEAGGVPFIDVGMGLELTNGSLGGILRVTTSTSEMRAHVHAGRVSFEGGGADNVYSSNIQVADLNALNAVLAVIKWKKLRGFYRDLDHEHHCTYTIDGNLLLNGDQS